MIADQQQVSPLTAQVGMKRVRPAGGSFDFLMGAYKQSRRKSRQRFISIIAGGSILALMAIFTAFQYASTTIAQGDLEAAQSEYTSVSQRYQAATGETPMTRAQLQKQIDSNSTSLKLAAQASVDVPTVLAEVVKVLPQGAQVKSVSIESWTDLSKKKGGSSTSPSASGSAAPSAAPPPVYQVTVVATLPVDQVGIFETNVQSLPFYAAQSSSTTLSNGEAETTITVKSKKPLSSPELQNIAGVTPRG